MFDRIRRLGADTAVYGVSTIIGRFLTFLLTPFYTHVLPRDELGVVATVYAYVAVFTVLYSYGMESAYMKYAATREMGNDRQVFSVPFFSVGVTAILLSLGIVWQGRPLAELGGVPEVFLSTVVYAAGILFLDAVAIIPFAALRMARKSVRFAAIKLAGILLNVGCNLLFLLVLRMGVEGIFLSNVISSLFTLLLLLPMIVRNLTSAWNGQLLRALLAFGLPYVPAGFAAMTIQVINRPILEALEGLDAVGLFQANYRLGIFMMLVVSMYDFAWRPFFLSHASDPDAKPMFARILTYFVLVSTGLFLLLTFFLGDVVRLPLFAGKALFHPAYWEGLGIVPVILLAYLLLGVYNNLVAGLYIEKRTALLPVATIAGAVVNVAANFLLIPSLSLMGAALATLLSYGTMAGTVFVIVQRVYPVRYEYGRLARIAVSAATVYLLSLLLPPGVVATVGKIGLLGAFVGLMYALGFFVPSETRAFSRLAGVTGHRGVGTAPGSRPHTMGSQDPGALPYGDRSQDPGDPST